MGSVGAVNGISPTDEGAKWIKVGQVAWDPRAGPASKFSCDTEGKLCSDSRGDVSQPSDELTPLGAFVKSGERNSLIKTPE